MLTVGLTGEAGSGKSFVCNILTNNFSIPVIDSDSVTKELMMPGHTVFNDVVREFGKEYLDENGYIDRAKLADLVFNDDNELKKLNELTHPATIAEILKQTDFLERNGCSLVVIESALALDANYGDFCDEFWYVHASEADRKVRLMNSRGWNEKKTKSVIASQKNEDFFREHCTLVIENPLYADEKQLISRLEEIVRIKIS